MLCILYYYNIPLIKGADGGKSGRGCWLGGGIRGPGLICMGGMSGGVGGVARRALGGCKGVSFGGSETGGAEDRRG